MPAKNLAGFFCCLSFFFLTFAVGTITTKPFRAMTRHQLTVLCFTALVMLAGCKEKKQPIDIIAEKVEAPKPSGPQRMQPYHDQRDVQWLGKTYHVEISREPDDSLAKVSDETGQQFVDNRISLTVRRADGSVAISKTFLKRTFESYIDQEYKRAGILEGFVFDEVDGNYLEFAASVSLPQTDEYIPLEVKIDNYGNLTIKRDSEMDTNGDNEEEDL